MASGDHRRGAVRGADAAPADASGVPGPNAGWASAHRPSHPGPAPHSGETPAHPGSEHPQFIIKQIFEEMTTDQARLRPPEKETLS